MLQRKMLPGQALAAMTLLAAVASLAHELRPMVGLDLVEDHTAEMMESMKADMVSCFWLGGLRFDLRTSALRCNSWYFSPRHAPA